MFIEIVIFFLIIKFCCCSRSASIAISGTILYLVLLGVLDHCSSIIRCVISITHHFVVALTDYYNNYNNLFFWEQAVLCS